MELEGEVTVKNKDEARFIALEQRVRELEKKHRKKDPTQVGISKAGDDFAAGGSTTLEVAVQAANGSVVNSDSTTEITFTPTLSGTVSGLGTGTLKAGESLGVPGGAVTVIVDQGVAAVRLEDTLPETFEVAITNNAGLSNPGNDVIVVTPPLATQVVIASVGCTFVANGSTILTVEVRDANGYLVAADSATEITFTPTLSGTVSGLGTGTLKAGETLGVPGGAVTVIVDQGVAAVTLTDTVSETFEVAIGNSAGLTNPTDSSIWVAASTGPVTVSLDPRSLQVFGATTFTVEVTGGAEVFRDSTDQMYDLQLAPGTVYTFTPIGTGVDPVSFHFTVCAPCGLRVVP